MSIKLFSRGALFCGLCVLVLSACGGGSKSTTTTTTSTPTYSQQATYGVQTLQNWYVQSSGLYQTPTGWWNAANAITVLVDYSKATNTTQYLSAVSNTFSNANKANGSTNFITDSKLPRHGANHICRYDNAVGYDHMRRRGLVEQEPNHVGIQKRHHQ
jgi:hypothetical protein